MLHTIPVCSEDDPFLFKVYASTRADEMRAWGWDAEMSRPFLHMQWLAQQRSYSMQYPNSDHHLIIFQNVRTGRIWVYRTEHDITLVDLSLLPEFQNLGLGTELLHRLQTDAAKRDIPLRLSVLKTNPARRLYERLGFQTTGGNELYDFMEWRMAGKDAMHSDKNTKR